MTPRQSHHSWQEGFGGDEIPFPHIGFESSELEEEAGALFAEGGMQDVGKHPLLQCRIPFEHGGLLCRNAEVVNTYGIHTGEKFNESES